MSLFSDIRDRFGAFAARRFPGWAHALRAGSDVVPEELVRRAQARQERRMAWWRLALAFVPLLEAWFDPARGAGGFAWGIVIYALGIVGLTSRRGYDARWRWGFALGDVLLLQAYATYHLAGLTAAEAAFAYVAAANVVIITNALRLSLPLLWASAAGMLAGYFALFREGMDDVRVRLGGVMLLLIGLSLATMIVRGQLRLLVEARARARLRRFVSPEVADELERRLEVIDRPVSREVTVLFVDIRGFTPSAETMDATDAVAFLNEFFRRVTDAVFLHGGTIDKYIGDCVMALFGAPLRQPDDAPRAVAASLEIVRSVAEWNGERVARGEPPIRVGVGLNTSLVVAGAVGTPQKLEYTVIGDGVNVASRVCSLTKELPAVILATEATRSRAPDFPWADLGDVTLRGRGAQLRIHGLVTATPPSPPPPQNG
ncbi:MAG: adenylate/guanylate cyclase domain-containing protein [Burkholderiales bacterium]|nr:adenylate/guanylate cyclase domain-containing protein [Opitutaceae bacterium]